MIRSPAASALWFALVLSVPLAAPAAAAGFAPLSGRSFTADLDARDGATSSWKAEDLAGANAVRIRFAIGRLGKGSRGAPVFTFKLLRGEQGKAIRIAAIEKSRALLVTIIPLGKDADSFAPSTLPVRIDPDKPVTLLLSWAEGQVTANFRAAADESGAGQSFPFTLPVAPDAFEVTASTGELQIQRAEFGRIAP